MIFDLVPNPFVGREIVGRFLGALRDRGFDDAKLGALASLIVEELRQGLDKQQNARAEAQFKADVTAGRIQFRLRLDGQNWQMPFETETVQPDGARQLVGNDGGPLQRSLFSPIYDDDFNDDERDVAVYLDGDAALSWWHSNVARSQYAVQGWRKAKIYPDFIFSVSRKDGSSRITVLETKGDQLDNLDTAYKREVLGFMSKNFSWDSAVPAGTLKLVKNTGETVDMTLVLISEWRSKLPTYLKP